ncbi:MAG: AAA family ATPase, partial [Candidatus Hermodarchaeota archaeon]
MIIQSVKLKNIRSIKNLEIEFPPSTMLFYGDIGSGKSSLLKAIEFGLFGTLTAAELSGDSLLRRGENKGTVELTFLIDNKKYTIKRNLKRTIKNKKITISQEEGSIIEYSGSNLSKTSYAPTDLRRKILKLLNYSITRYENAQKIPLFRYTVYTPQEQVKEILQAKPEERFEILKDVFGIEKYEIALKNIGVLNEFLYSSIKETKIYLDSIGNPDLLINKKEKEIDAQLKIVNKIEASLAESIADLERVEQQVDTFQSEVNEYSKKSVEINNYYNIVEESNISKKENENSHEILLQEILALERELQSLPKLKLDIDLTEEQLEEQIKEHRKNQSKKEKHKVILEEKINNINTLLKEGKCSLCGQEIHEKERFNFELTDTNKKIENFSKEINELLNQMNNIELNLKNLRAFTINQTKIASLSRLIEEKRKREDKLKELINQLAQKIKESQEKIKKILKRYGITDLKNFKDYENQLNLKLSNQKNLIKKIKLEKSEIEKSLSAETARLKILTTELDKLNENLKEKKNLQEKLAFLTDLRNWITEDFQILIRDIEREIISASARQFNEYFKEWFGTLVEEDNIEVEIRLEDFEPIIMVNGYESPFRDLSGGEKSALSLAYRLALDKIINERYQEVKTKDLLILDEPTDGFSQEQINKMQDIFEKLNTTQMFIISHDRNLDSFVTDIYNFQKINHQTKVKRE